MLGCSRRRPMRAPVRGSACARIVAVCALCALWQACCCWWGVCSVCSAALACDARVLCACACWMRVRVCVCCARAAGVCCVLYSAVRPVCEALRRRPGWQGCAVGCGALRVVVRLPGGVRRPRNPPDRVVGGPGRDRASYHPPPAAIRRISLSKRLLRNPPGRVPISLNVEPFSRPSTRPALGLECPCKCALFKLRPTRPGSFECVSATTHPPRP